MPGALDEGARAELLRQFSPGEAEWVVLGVAMMGFLNKFMDALGVELEPSTVAEVDALIAPSGWSVGKHGEALGSDGAAAATPAGAARGRARAPSSAWCR